MLLEGLYCLLDMLLGLCRRCAFAERHVSLSAAVELAACRLWLAAGFLECSSVVLSLDLRLRVAAGGCTPWRLTFRIGSLRARRSFMNVVCRSTAL